MKKKKINKLIQELTKKRVELIEKEKLPDRADQFNSLQDKLIERFTYLARKNSDKSLHFSCCKKSPTKLK